MLEASASVWTKFTGLKLEAASSSILVQKTFYIMCHTNALHYVPYKHFILCAIQTLYSMCHTNALYYVPYKHFTLCAIQTLYIVCHTNTLQYVPYKHFILCAIQTPTLEPEVMTICCW